METLRSSFLILLVAFSCLASTKGEEHVILAERSCQKTHGSDYGLASSSDNGTATDDQMIFMHCVVKTLGWIHNNTIDTKTVIQTAEDDLKNERREVIDAVINAVYRCKEEREQNSTERAIEKSYRFWICVMAAARAAGEAFATTPSSA